MSYEDDIARCSLEDDWPMRNICDEVHLWPSL